MAPRHRASAQKATQAAAPVVYSAAEQVAAAEELARRELLEQRTRAQQAAYLAGLSDKQREVIAHKAKVKTVRTGRRGGKTHLLARLLIKRAQDREGALCLFIALTRPSAKRLIWGELHKVNRLHQLGIDFNAQDLTATLPNGSQIWLAGATTGHEIEKLRGHPFDLICCDESGSFGTEQFEYLLKEVLNASLEDYDGELVLVGTPNAAAAGAFFDYDTSEAEHIAHFHWTVLDNPNFPRWRGKKNWRELAKRWWADKCKREGWAEDDPVMHREWLAKWVRDANRLVYRVSPDNLLHGGATFTHDDYDFVLGADLGWSDAKTIVVLACHKKTNKLVYVDCFEQSGMLIDDFADTMKSFQTKYKPIAIVCDAGALGKDLVELMRQRRSLPIIAAKKSEKPGNIAFLNSALKSQRVMFSPEAKAVYRQMSLLQWKDKFQLKTDQAFREDLCDAGLYAFRYVTNELRPVVIPDVPKEGTVEWLNGQAARAKAAALRRNAQAQHGDADSLEAEIAALVGAS